MRFAGSRGKGLGRLASGVGVGGFMGARTTYAALSESAKRVAQLPPGELSREDILCVDRAKHMASVRTVPAPPPGKNTMRIPTQKKKSGERHVLCVALLGR